MSRLQEIEFLRVKGGIFAEDVDLPLFKKSKQIPIFTLLYGKNGTGKSTISRAISKISGKEEKQIVKAEFLAEDGSVLIIDDSIKEAIFVFNEDFVDDNIRIDEDGLESIVVMGAVKEADDKIRKHKPDYEKSVEAAQRQQDKYSKYLDVKNTLCPDYYVYEMVKALKGDDNWAGRDARINDKKTNSQVKTDTYTQFVSLKPTRKRDELIVEFDKLYKALLEAKSGSKRVEKAVPQLAEYIDNEAEILKVLSVKIERPELTEREKRIFSLLQEENGNQKVNSIKMFFKRKEKTFCPFCFQEVEAEYADSLIDSIEKLLSKIVENHQRSLCEKKLERVEMDLSEFVVLPEVIYKECEDAISLYNAAVDEVNKLIEQKCENVYIPIIREAIGLKTKYDTCRECIKKLEEARVEYNKTATDTSGLVGNLRRINADIAYYDIIALYSGYKAAHAEKEREEKVLKDLIKDRDEKKRLLDTFEQEKKDAKIAMKAINDDLAYIFFSKNRLRIEHKDGKYMLFSHGNPVQPSNVSVGERNAIALCYFFNRIMKDKDEDDVYKQPYLLVIDDPVSSFDTENRIGILSYLKYKLGQFLIGNKDSRSLILSHDLQTFFDTRSLLTELLIKLFETPNILPGKYGNYLIELELKNKMAENTQISGRSEYTALFEIIYKYAVTIDSTYSHNIGNIMRKVMEAYGTFVYKKGMSELSTNEQILAGLNTNDKKYFENLMYRLVLNTGSHMQEKVCTIEDMKFFDFISDSDKQRTARDIICFLYKLNPLHVLAHLKECENAKVTIEQWCEDISV